MFDLGELPPRPTKQGSPPLSHNSTVLFLPAWQARSRCLPFIMRSAGSGRTSKVLAARRRTPGLKLHRMLRWHSAGKIQTSLYSGGKSTSCSPAAARKTPNQTRFLTKSLIEMIINPQSCSGVVRPLMIEKQEQIYTKSSEHF